MVVHVHLIIPIRVQVADATVIARATAERRPTLVGEHSTTSGVHRYMWDAVRHMPLVRNNTVRNKGRHYSTGHATTWAAGFALPYDQS